MVNGDSGRGGGRNRGGHRDLVRSLLTAAHAVYSCGETREARRGSEVRLVAEIEPPLPQPLPSKFVLPSSLCFPVDC
jgi:hypothetical protein